LGANMKIKYVNMEIYIFLITVFIRFSAALVIAFACLPDKIITRSNYAITMKNIASFSVPKKVKVYKKLGAKKITTVYNKISNSRLRSADRGAFVMVHNPVKKENVVT